ncbi:MAG: hypothetical protein FJW36_09605 [Acidobacteria bacterium]|nr:hypothetical protein [Acidobacteriota bacterium]
MLWLKSWTKVRFRFALAVFLAIYILALIFLYFAPQFNVRFKAITPQQLGQKIWAVFILAYGGLLLPVSAKILAGSGINAQTSMGMAHGFHGSMSFLLSMPASRTRLMATRALTGAALLFLLAITTFAVAIYAPPASISLSTRSMPGTTCPTRWS